mmetsp:Transcript_34502/g.103071  ORF Transcript_34502/g.103071 Transcript_34502/m.103071 type:complete len:256 (-) Transcript_34502:130-897(-)
MRWRRLRAHTLGALLVDDDRGGRNSEEEGASDAPADNRGDGAGVARRVAPAVGILIERLRRSLAGAAVTYVVLVPLAVVLVAVGRVCHPRVEGARLSRGNAAVVEAASIVDAHEALLVVFRAPIAALAEAAPARVAPSPARIAGAARDLMSGRHGRRRGRFRGRQIVRIHQTHLGAQPCGLVGSGDVVPSAAALPLWAAIGGAALSGRLVGDADSCGRRAVVDIVRAALSRADVLAARAAFRLGAGGGAADLISG